ALAGPWSAGTGAGGGGRRGPRAPAAPPLRAAAASAKQALLKLASASLAVPVASLSVKDGVVSGGGKTITYGQLVGGKLINATLVAPTMHPGVSPAKPVSQYKVVGTNVPRVDIAHKVPRHYTSVHNTPIPPMLHARC